MMESILIISTTNQDCDPRVLRQIEFLQNDFDVWCCGLQNSIIPKSKFIKLDINESTFSRIPVLLLRLLKLYSALENYWIKYKIKIKSEQINFDYIIANDLDTLPLAFKFFESNNVICDFHEYAPAEFEDRFTWRVLHQNFAIHQCKKYFPKLKLVTTVCDGIADEFENNFGKRPVVITNAASYHDLHPSSTTDKIKLIHHGAAIPSRKLEIMIEVAKLLDERFELDFMLMPNDKNYYEHLVSISKNVSNVQFILPISFDDIIPFCNNYDAGIFILPYSNFNYKFALPNKFFEFVQSRLAVITGPSPEMAKLINKFELGIVCDSFDASRIANKLNETPTEQFSKWKINSHNAAKDLSSERNKNLLIEQINSI